MTQKFKFHQGRVENNVEKGGNTGYQKFLCFPCLKIAGGGNENKKLYRKLLTLTSQKILDSSKLTALAKEKSSVVHTIKILFEMVGYVTGKEKKCWQSVISTISQCFQKGVGKG